MIDGRFNSEPRFVGTILRLIGIVLSAVFCIVVGGEMATSATKTNCEKK